jgi:hypothetical protein
MLENINDANLSQTLRAVTQKGTDLCRRAKVGTDWEDIPLELPFALDFGSLQHGWVNYPAKGSGLRAEWDMVPVVRPLPDDERPGWVPIATCNIASKELNGLARLEITRANLRNAVVDLHKRYVGYANAARDEIPVVSMRVDPVTADMTFTIECWVKRPLQFGERLNPIPRTPGSEPKRQEVSGNGLSKFDPRIVEMLRQKQEDARRTVV